MHPQQQWRLVRMLSIYNMILAYVFFIGNTHSSVKQFIWVQDIVAAIAILIAISVSLYYLKFGFNVMTRFYSRLFGFEFPIILTLFFECVVHYIPPLLLGFPSNPWSFVFAYVIICAWYILVRDDINIIYDNDLKAFVDKTVITLLPLCLTLAFLTRRVRTINKTVLK
jgi:hypothetical protein